MNQSAYDDRSRIKKTADQLAGDAKILTRPAGTVFPISQYAFHTPVEFQQQMAEVWDKLEKPEMKKFLPVITAAVYKNKEEETDIVPSEFNYEF